jgi:hypothetical protein
MMQRANNQQPFSKGGGGECLFSIPTIEVLRFSETTAEYLPDYRTSHPRRRDGFMVLRILLTVVKRFSIQEWVRIFKIISLIFCTFLRPGLAQSVSGEAMGWKTEESWFDCR